MADITAAEVKKLRDATGAGMMDAKKALQECDGDFDKAVELLRTKGAAKAIKRGAERTARNGLIASTEGTMVEINCETDFVAKNDQFQKLAADVVALAAATKSGDAETLAAQTLADGQTVQQAVDGLAAVIGEKLVLGRVVHFDGQVATYMHRRSADLPAQVGVLVEFTGDDLDTARGVAMQVAAMRPLYAHRADVPDEVVENERRIAEATAREEGKPEAALAKIVEGRVNGFFKETVLVEQSSVQDSKKTVQQLLDGAGIAVTRFARLEVGQE